MELKGKKQAALIIISAVLLIIFAIIFFKLWNGTSNNGSGSKTNRRSTAFSTTLTTSSSHAPSPSSTTARNNTTLANHLDNIRNIITEFWGNDLSKVGAIYYDTESGGQVAINEEAWFEAASTIKVPVCMALCNKLQKGEISLYDTIHYNPDTDFEYTIYSAERLAQPFTIRELMHDVIVYSDNVAVNMLLRVLNHTGHHDFIETLGPFEIPRWTNKITPTAGFAVLKNLFENPDNNEYYDMVINDMKASALHDRITRDIPIEICAHKSGDYIGYANDTAIIYTDKPFILLFYVDNLWDAHNRIALVSRKIYDAHIEYYESENPEN